MSNNYHAIMNTPLGKLGISVKDNHLSVIDFLSGSCKVKTSDSPIVEEVVYQLKQYFKNPEWEFSIPLSPAATLFKRKVRTALKKIPVGETYSYGDLARRLKTAPRAVGGACRSNSVPIIIPCHRVVSQMGIGGFSGSTQGKEIRIKRWLLEHEGVVVC